LGAFGCLDKELTLIINRYLIREVLLPFLAVGGVLTAIFTTYSMTRFLDQAADGILLTSELVQLTLLKSLIAQEVLWPVSLFVALVIALGRLYSDWEMTALKSFGFAEYRTILPVLLVALLMALAVGFFSFIGRPWAYNYLYQLQANAEVTSEIDRIKPGRFYGYEDESRIVFIESFDSISHELTGFFVRSIREGQIETISAPFGKVKEFNTNSSHEIVLRDAQVVRHSKDDNNFLGLFKLFKIEVPIAAVQPISYNPKSESSFVLMGSSSKDDQAEYQWRLSTPISTMLLALLAIPLGRSRPRQGRFGRLTLAIVIYAMYFNLLGIGRSWVEQGTMASMWWVSIAFGILVFSFYIPWGYLKAWMDREL